MATNGLLINLSDDKSMSEAAIAEMTACQKIEIGERNERWLPIVVEADGVGDSHDIHEWIENLPGVVAVDVIFASVEEPQKQEKK